jgi:hypothetical protein
MIDISLALALFLLILVFFNSARIRTKWFKPELSIIEILFVIIVSYIIVLQF